MPTVNNTYIPPEIQRLMKLGKEKKLWALEILFNVQGPSSTKLKWIRNLDDNELFKYREMIFKYGFSTPIKPGHWRIICPMDIVQVDIHRQDRYIMDTMKKWEEPDQPNG